MSAPGYGTEARPRMGFFTDTSLCIGCKACEVACKEWNRVPESPQGFTGHSYDNTIDLGANTWRHVAFVEQRKELGVDGGDLLGSLTLDELVAAALILYPTYVSRTTRRFTTPERALQELVEWRATPRVPRWRHWVARLFREA